MRHSQPHPGGAVRLPRPGRWLRGRAARVDGPVRGPDHRLPGGPPRGRVPAERWRQHVCPRRRAAARRGLAYRGPHRTPAARSLAAAAEATSTGASGLRPVVLLGHSSGAHLAAVSVLAPAGVLPRCSHPAARFVGLVGLAGPYDLSAVAEQAEPLLGAPPAADPAAWRAADPLLLAGHPPPGLAVLLMLGAVDQLVPSRHMVEMARVLRRSDRAHARRRGPRHGVHTASRGSTAPSVAVSRGVAVGDRVAWAASRSMQWPAARRSSRRPGHRARGSEPGTRVLLVDVPAHQASDYATAVARAPCRTTRGPLALVANRATAQARCGVRVRRAGDDRRTS